MQENVALRSMEEENMRRRIIFEQNQEDRSKFLDDLRKKGLRGSAYSDAVVEYDRVNNSRRLY